MRTDFGRTLACRLLILLSLPPGSHAAGTAPMTAAPAAAQPAAAPQVSRTPAAKVAYDAGIAFMAKKKHVDAMKSFREVLRLQPDDDEASNQLGNALLELNRIDEAAQAFREALRLKPDTALYHHNLGFAYYRQQRHVEAGKSVREALARNPKDPNTHTLLGHIELALENYAAAVAAYQEAVRLIPAPEISTNFFNLGNAQLKTKDYEPAIENLQASLRLDADNSDAMNALGVGLFRTGRFELALEQFRKASYRRPKEMAIHANIGNALFRLGHVEAAKRVHQALQQTDAAMAKLLQDEFNNPGVAAVSVKKPAAAPPPIPARPQSFRNPGIALEWLPPGSFTMGNRGQEDEFPEHRVTVATGFYIGKYEVTQAEWEAVMGANPSLNQSCGGNCPVDQVSWNDVQQFLAYLNQDDHGFRYRLPSEAEWEYAYRAGTSTPYYAQGDLGWSEENASGKSHPVGGKLANAFELFDMAGNVNELCADIHQRSFHGAPTDGSAWLMEIGTAARVQRGGSFRTRESQMTASSRRIAGNDERSNQMGFRVVATRRSPAANQLAGGSSAEWLARADQHRVAKEFPAAIDAYRKAIFLDPNLTQAHRALAAIYREQKDFQRAVLWSQEAVRLDPDDAELHAWVGSIQFNLKKYDDALASYRESVRLQPDMANGWYGLGMTSVTLKKKAEAEAALAKLQKLDAKLAAELKLGISKMK